MPWGSQTWLRATKELSYGVRNPSPGPSDILWFRLYSDNAFTMRPTPQRQVIRSADAGNRRRQVVSARTVYQGGLATLAYPSQMPYIMTAAANITGNDLNSYTLDFFDSTRVQGYLGGKISNLSLTSSATQDYVTLSLAFTAQRLDSTLTVLPQPADSVFPAEVPYEHVETAGNVTVGSVQSKYASLSLTIANVLGPTWDELPYITNLYYCGRDVGFTFNPQYLSATLRQELEAQSALSCSLLWNRPSTSNELLVSAQTKNYIASISDSIPLGGPAYQTVTVETFFDGAATTDMSVTAS
jgi:hypothetical protein